MATKKVGKYYVYFVRLYDEIIYVGMGHGNRIDHVNSGASHIAAHEGIMAQGQELRREHCTESKKPHGVCHGASFNALQARACHGVASLFPSRAF